MSKNKDPNSLLNIQHDYFYSTIKNVQVPGQLYNLIIDDNAEKLLYHVLSKEQLLRIVASIEKIDARRRQSTFMTAIYLCDFSTYNFKCIQSDVQVKRYKAGIALFSRNITENSARDQRYYDSKFKSLPNILNYFGDSIHFINSSFYPVESRIFMPDDKTPNSMPVYYNPNCREYVMTQVGKVANCLLNLMIVMDEYPLIRYYSPNKGEYEAKTLSQLIAITFQEKLDEYYRNNENYSPQSNPNKQRAILLICDRTLDLYAPILHEFSYQAMAMDIIESLERENVYRYQTENEKGEIADVETALDNENDEDWINLRHLHIIESSELIYNKISEMIKNNPMMIDRSKASTSSDLMYIVAHLKGFDEERKQLTLHKSLIDKCLDINANRKLAEFAADFEQTCCAEGITFEGERNKHLHDDLIVLLARDDLHINDKMRLILIYTFYRGGLVRSDFEKLIKFIGVNDKHITGLVEKCFNNVDKLGFELFKKSVKEKAFMKEMYHQINNEGTYNTSRFIPGIKRVLQNSAKYSLDREEFPYSRDQPLDEDLPSTNTRINQNKDLQSSNGTLRNSRIKASWATNTRNSVGGGSSSHKQKQRIFAYVAGGISYNEIRSIYELAASMNKEFYLGSESILKPRDFLIGLQSIGENKTLSNLNLNVVNEAATEKEIPMYLYEDGRSSSIPVNNHQPQQPQNNTLSSQQQQFQQQVQQQQQMYQQKHKGETLSQAPSHYQKRQQSGQVPQSPIPSTSSSDSNTKSKRSKLKKLFK